MSDNKQPMQPIEVAEDGAVRFKPNKLVRFLLDANGKIDMNMLAAVPGITLEDRAQFAQLIGYSVEGYAELSYAVDVDVAWRKMEELKK